MLLLVCAMLFSGHKRVRYEEHLLSEQSDSVNEEEAIVLLAFGIVPDTIKIVAMWMSSDVRK